MAEARDLPNGKDKQEEVDEVTSDSASNAFASRAREASNEATEPASTREENPFSFRHFLRRSQGSPSGQGITAAASNTETSRTGSEEHQAIMYGGARPKTYRTQQRESQSNPPSRPHSHLEIKSPCGLPDFVQDHLVVEQELTSQTVNLPNGFHYDSFSGKSPLDLPRSPSPIHTEGGLPIPLDIANLATLDLANLNAAAATDNMPHFEVPADMPQVDEINNNESVHQALGQLPDFLSDGPMHSERGVPDLQEAVLFEPPNPVPLETSPTTSRFQSILEENERLRQDLEASRRSERAAIDRVAQLERLLEDHRSRENQESATIERAIEGVERNLQQATKRAVQAETQVSQLLQEIRGLEAENSRLVEENERLRGRDSSGELQRRVHRTAQDLQLAANTAERSVRELLNGVEHLRVIAAALESTDRFEEVSSRRKRDK